MFIIVSNIGFLLTERSSDSHISLQFLTLSQNRQSSGAPIGVNLS
jgi:hypothetical protein